MTQNLSPHYSRKSPHPSWHFYAAIWGIVIGDILSVSLKLTYCQGYIWLLTALIFLMIAIKFHTVFCMGLAFVAGLILANWRVTPEINDQNIWAQLIGQSLIISGKISEDPEFNSRGTTLKLEKLCFWSPGVQTPDSSEDATCLSGSLYAQLSTQSEVARSDYVKLQGKLGEGFGTFVGSLYRPQILAIDKITLGDVFYQLKTNFANLVRQNIPAPQSDLGLGYLMGMKSGLSEDFSEALQVTGMTHVVVASGAHLAILSGAIKKLFGRISKFAGTLFGILAILSFALIVGFTPSMTRASLVAILSLLTAYVGRKFTPIRLLGFVGALTLLLKPFNFINLGWQLSFASFFGILVLAPYLQRILYGGKNPPWLISMLLTSFSTSLICAPVLIYNFGSLSLLSFAANLIILPTLPYVMLLVVLTGATSFLPFLANVFAQLSLLLLNLHIIVINFLSEKTIFVINLPDVGLKIFLLYIPVVIFLALPQLRRYYKKYFLKSNHKITTTQVVDIEDG